MFSVQCENCGTVYPIPNLDDNTTCPTCGNPRHWEEDDSTTPDDPGTL